MCIEPLEIRKIKIGEGLPKICVPIIGRTRKEIINEAEKLKSLPADMAEWRADWFEEISDLEKVKEVLADLREILDDMPLLFTFRTASEGGEKETGGEEYVRMNRSVIDSGCVDLIDVELFSGDDIVKEIIRKAHEYGVKAVVSNHDFYKTPEKEEIVRRLCKMQDMDADILKIAVMPESSKDVITLLMATEEMNRRYAKRPVVTMSMSGTGAISRLCGEVFGSAITFATAGKASAPGQINAKDLAVMLKVLHEI